MQVADTFTIRLPQFEGPFDLLLFFIERDELDIHDIPISRITDDFLGYLRQMEALNIDLASEFILVAATLMRIKAKMLLPRKELDEQGQEIDPRDELVQRLLEYKRYKSVLEDIRTLEESQALRFGRGNTSRELQRLANKAMAEAELESITAFKLLKAFEGVLNKLDGQKVKVTHRVYNFVWTIQGQQAYILSKISFDKKAGFDDIFGECEDRVQAIVTFLALLELLNLMQIKCIAGEGVNNMWVEPRLPEDELPDLEEESDALESTST